MKAKKILVSLIKILVSVFLLYFVLTKISFQEIIEIIKQSNLFLIVISALFLLFSQVVSSYRLNVLFHSLGYHLSEKSNLILYFIGMFYNFFIPGGIGGDAYKVYKLNKQFGWSVKKLSGSILVDRLSGLTIIIVFILLLSYPFTSVLVSLSNFYVLPILIIVAFLVFVASYVFVSRLFKSYKTVYLKTLMYSFFVQGAQLISVYCLVLSFGDATNMVSYLVVFLVSVILSIVSFAGIGVREYVFYKAADLLQYSKDTSVAIGLLFTFLTALISLVGLFFQIKKVDLKKV